jgi:transposase InsO family protein
MVQNKLVKGFTALDGPAYGSRRITRELKAQGWEVNRKRVQRILREDNLLCVAKRKFVVRTDSSARAGRSTPIWQPPWC